MANIVVRGATVDQQTRCVHYASPLDVVAIRFACCGEYYPCYRCHEEAAGHPIEVWSASAFDTRAVLCGVCRYELTIAEYLATAACPHCGARFNPGCHAHAHHYFAVGRRLIACLKRAGRTPVPCPDSCARPDPVPP